MTLDEAIRHCEEEMMENLEKTKDRNASDPIAINCFECADEHRQLAAWLKELKAYKLKESRSEIPNTCGDAISRQAVIDLMRGLTRWCVRSEDGKWKNVGLLYDDVMFGIDELPSVTPQQRKTQMLDESNFDVNQYEMDLQSAYDCGRASTQQRTGRWIQKEEEGDAEPFIIWECSECHCVDEDGKPSYKYCPQCGARMEVEE